MRTLTAAGDRSGAAATVPRLTETAVGDPVGVVLRARMLAEIVSARAALAETCRPLAARLARARGHVRQARLILKLWKRPLGPSHAPRVARLKVCARGLKAFAGETGSPGGPTLVAGAPGGDRAAAEAVRRIDVLDAMLRRCEVDAVTLVPALIDADAVAGALRKARKAARSRAVEVLARRDADALRRWHKAIDRHARLVVLSELCSTPADRRTAERQQELLEALADYRRLDALHGRLKAASCQAPSLQRVRDERRRLWRRLRRRAQRFHALED